jgi:Ras-related protein Rab-1A
MADYNLYKILLLGDCSSGKTSLIYRLVHNSFLEYYVSTIGIDFNIKSFVVNDKKVKLQIWDSCGQERFNALTRSYYRNTDAFIICYDISSRKSFEDAKYWIKELEKYVFDRPVIKILVGTKADLEDSRNVKYDDGKKYADSLGIEFIETSSKNNSNIKELFYNLSLKLLDKISDGNISTIRRKPLFLQNEHKPKKYCCN